MAPRTQAVARKVEKVVRKRMGWGVVGETGMQGCGAAIVKPLGQLGRRAFSEMHSLVVAVLQ